MRKAESTQSVSEFAHYEESFRNMPNCRGMAHHSMADSIAAIRSIIDKRRKKRVKSMVPRTDHESVRFTAIILPKPDTRGSSPAMTNEECHAARLPKRARLAFCLSLRGGSLNRRAAVPPMMLCLAFSVRNGRSQTVEGRSKSQCG